MAEVKDKQLLTNIAYSREGNKYPALNVFTNPDYGNDKYFIKIKGTAQIYSFTKR